MSLTRLLPLGGAADCDDPMKNHQVTERNRSRLGEFGVETARTEGDSGKQRRVQVQEVSCSIAF